MAASRFLMRPRARAFRNVLLQFFLEMSVTLPQRQTMRSLFLRTLSVENAYIPQSRHGMQIRMSRMEPFFLQDAGTVCGAVHAGNFEADLTLIRRLSEDRQMDGRLIIPRRRFLIGAAAALAASNHPSEVGIGADVGAARCSQAADAAERAALAVRLLPPAFQV
jgi:hypothetical protein